MAILGQSLFAGALPRIPPTIDEVEITFAINLPGNGRVEYAGPIAEGASAKIMAILGQSALNVASGGIPATKTGARSS